VRIAAHEQPVRSAAQRGFVGRGLQQPPGRQAATTNEAVMKEASIMCVKR
jgi:hypothetical protein